MNPICPLCKSDKSVLAGQAGNISLYSCNQCGLLFKPTENLDRSSVQELQDGVYRDLRLRTEVQMLYKMAQDRLDDLKKYKTSGRLLEVGCATGEFLELAQKSGFEVLGIDASGLFAEFSKSKGLDVRNGLVEEVLSEDEKFDVVAMFHLIEHIPDPVSFLETIKSHLSDDGLIFIVCPNLNSKTRKIFGYWHSNFQQPDHLTFFSDKTIADLVTRAGFYVESVFSREYPHSFFTSLRGYLALRIGALKKSRKQLTKAPDTSAPKPKQVNQNEKSLYKYLYKQVPYWLGSVLSPILRPMGRRMEEQKLGHELCLIAYKKSS